MSWLNKTSEYFPQTDSLQYIFYLNYRRIRRFSKIQNIWIISSRNYCSNICQIMQKNDPIRMATYVVQNWSVYEPKTKDRWKLLMSVMMMWFWPNTKRIRPLPVYQQSIIIINRSKIVTMRKMTNRINKNGKPFEIGK